MGRNMGISWLTTGEPLCLRKKHRWLFFIDGISDDGTNALPPLKSSRPSLSFKEMEVQHLNETIYFPGKPDWKPISLTLYDVKSVNPVFNWVKEIYDPKKGSWNASSKRTGLGFKKRARLELYDGCGNTLECWTFENAWPQSVEWGELDMSQGEVVTCDLMLRYDRAFIDSCDGNDEEVTEEPFLFRSAGDGGNLRGPTFNAPASSLNSLGFTGSRGITPEVITGANNTEDEGVVEEEITTPSIAYEVGGTKGPKIGTVIAGTVAGIPVSWGYNKEGKPVAVIQGAVIPVPHIGTLPAKGLPGLPAGKTAPIRV